MLCVTHRNTPMWTDGARHRVTPMWPQPPGPPRRSAEGPGGPDACQLRDMLALPHGQKVPREPCPGLQCKRLAEATRGLFAFMAGAGGGGRGRSQLHRNNPGGWGSTRPHQSQDGAPAWASSPSSTSREEARGCRDTGSPSRASAPSRGGLSIRGDGSPGPQLRTGQCGVPGLSPQQSCGLLGGSLRAVRAAQAVCTARALQGTIVRKGAGHAGPRPLQGTTVRKGAGHVGPRPEASAPSELWPEMPSFLLDALSGGGGGGALSLASKASPTLLPTAGRPCSVPTCALPSAQKRPQDLVRAREFYAQLDQPWGVQIKRPPGRV